MKPPRAEELQTILEHGHLDRAVEILQQLDPAVAADAFMGMPWEQQQVLFRRLPVGFAATLAPIFPYYHTFVLLHTLPKERMTAVIGQMNPIERSTFLDELPEETWQQITSELAESHPAESPQDGQSASGESTGIDRVARPVSL